MQAARNAVLGLALGSLVAAGGAGAVAPAAGAAVTSKRAQGATAKQRLAVTVLSGRADLVSGGDALVAPPGVRSTRGLTPRAAGRDPTPAFSKDAAGRVLGLVKDLPLGKSRVVARTRRRAARLVVTNHPIGGPVFSGPQVRPWTCQPTARDARCDEPSTFTLLYKSSDPAKS